MTDTYTLNELHVMSDLPQEAIEKAIGQIKMAHVLGHTIWIAGNGGSAATAEHFACDLLLHNINAVCLNSNGAAFTALSNDKDYAWVLSWLISTQAKMGDTLVVISTSGNSKNVIQAARQALLNKVYVIGMTGQAGGELAKIVDLNLAVPTDDTQICEDLHLMITHMIVRSL